jgi:activator of HSP90 ATPase
MQFERLKLDRALLSGKVKMTEELKLSILLPVKPEELYHAWQDSKTHAAFTGDAAVIDPKVGGKFTAWNGYIMGKNLELESPRRIFQSWRTTEFPEDALDSLLEILIEPTGKGSKLTLIHTQIPKGQAEQYKEGWLDYCFTPMKAYFNHK